MAISSDVYLAGRFFGGPSSWFAGRNLVRTLRADSASDVDAVIEGVESAASEGLTCAGFLAYEAFGSPRTPLAWFQCFESFEPVHFPFGDRLSTPKMWRSSVSEDEFVQNIGKIKKYMESGDTYQVNYTFRLRSHESDARALMARMVAAQPDCYGAYFDTGELVVCSVSPEMFLTIDGDAISTRPMKGTRSRGRTQETDEAMIDELVKSEKERAENLMIVDMARNDLGRIAEVGTVRTPKLFTVETHKTLHQLTSEVHAKSSATLLDIFKATFPPASITGAPKVRTMEIIDELETSSRGVYTGCIGVVGPGRKAVFSVAIRTATLSDGVAEYGVGAGIVWDSDAKSEWEECLLKGAVLGAIPPDTRLIETMRYEAESGYFLLDRHIKRLISSAEQLGFVCDEASVRAHLSLLKEQMLAPVHRVRLLLSSDGTVETEHAPLSEVQKTINVGLKRNAVRSDDPLLRHKTTQRSVFEIALAEFPDCDDVILINERGELTEGCKSNLLVKLDGQWFTPPVECGLLPGTLRQEMLEKAELKERVMKLADLRRAEDIQLVNSVRGRQKVYIQAKIRI